MLRRQMPRSRRRSPRLLPRQRRRSRKVPRSPDPNLHPTPIRPPAIRFLWRSRRPRRKGIRSRTLRSPPSRCKIVRLQIQALHCPRQQIRVENRGSPPRLKTTLFPRRNRRRRRRETITKTAQQEREIFGGLELRSPVRPPLPKAGTVPAMHICRTRMWERAISGRIPSWIHLRAIKTRMDESTTT